MERQKERQSQSVRKQVAERRPYPFRRRVVASRIVAAPYAEVARAARVCLPQLVVSALRWQRSSPYDLIAAVSPRPFRGLLRIPVDLECSSPRDSSSGVVAHVRWSPHRFTCAFPEMDADLVARAAPGGLTELAIVGTYRPPFGFLGVVGDVLVGRSVARSTAEAFIEQVGDALEHALREGRCSAEQLPDARRAA